MLKVGINLLLLIGACVVLGYFLGAWLWVVHPISPTPKVDPW